MCACGGRYKSIESPLKVERPIPLGVRFIPAIESEVHLKTLLAALSAGPVMLVTIRQKLAWTLGTAFDSHQRTGSSDHTFAKSLLTWVNVPLAHCDTIFSWPT
jgi:hypothetical protein